MSPGELSEGAEPSQVGCRKGPMANGRPCDRLKAATTSETTSKISAWSPPIAATNGGAASAMSMPQVRATDSPRASSSASLDPGELLQLQRHQQQHPGASSSSLVLLERQQQQQQQQWLAQVAAQTHQEMRQRMSQASDQLGHSLRQLYASASSIAAAGNDVLPPAYHNIPGIVPFDQGRAIGPPPSYDDVINPYAPPPTYHSLFGQMREARKSSNGLLDLLRRLLIILVSTLGCTILIVLMILIPFSMIIVGATYIDECRIEHIPAFLLVGGLVWAAKSVIHCYAQCSRLPPGAFADSDTSSDVLATGDATNYEEYDDNEDDDNDGAGSELADSDEYLSSSCSSPVSVVVPDAALSDVEAVAVAARRASAACGGATTSINRMELREGVIVGAAAVAAPGGDQQTLERSLATVLANNSPPFNHRNQDANRRHHRQHRRHRRRHHRHNRPQQRRLSNAAAERSTSRLKSSICESLLNCVLFGWFIAGCVIVLRNYEPDFNNPSSARYCHKTVYMFTFWLIASANLLLGLFIGCICCLMVSSAITSRQSEADLA